MSFPLCLSLLGAAGMTAMAVRSDVCTTLNSDGDCGLGVGVENLLIQLQTASAGLAKSDAANGANGPKVTSDCAKRIGNYDKRHAACLVVRHNEALLVWVPYGGSKKGWDFPGGQKKGSREHACETAERETCEETGYQVRAVEKLSYNVFKCEFVAADVCRKSVDEGFLKKSWYARDDLDNLRFRGGTWGDKKALIKQGLVAGEVSGQAETHNAKILDVCGCRSCAGEGYSSGAKGCAVGSATQVFEADACMKKNKASKGVDTCGCSPSLGEGWSSRRSSCARGSDTDPREACACASRSALVEQRRLTQA